MPLPHPRLGYQSQKMSGLSEWQYLLHVPYCSVLEKCAVRPVHALAVPVRTVGMYRYAARRIQCSSGTGTRTSWQLVAPHGGRTRPYVGQRYSYEQDVIIARSKPGSVSLHEQLGPPLTASCSHTVSLSLFLSPLSLERDILYSSVGSQPPTKSQTLKS